MADESATKTEDNNGKSDTEKMEEEEEEEEEISAVQKVLQRLHKFYMTYEFLILIVAAILIARAYPPLGANYLQPKITATWIAVVFIFLMAGLGLKTEEFKKAFQRIWFNLFVQIFNFGVVSGFSFGFSRALRELGVLESSLADGMVACACLPLTINMVLVLTKSAGGDEASAIFNAAFGNMLGVFLSPVLMLGYLGVTGDVDLVSVFYKLALRVVLPVATGQILQKTSKSIVNFVKENKKHFKKVQSYALIFIVYTVFCRTFENDEASSGATDILVMIVFQGLLLCAVMLLAWIGLGLLFRNEPTLRVMGLFGCSHKTVALGVPLINAVYESDPNLGSYTLPLLIWHPMQLVIGSFLAPKLLAFVHSEKERLGIVDEKEDGKGEQAVVSDTTEIAESTMRISHREQPSGV